MDFLANPIIDLLIKLTEWLAYAESYYAEIHSSFISNAQHPFKKKDYVIWNKV